MTLIAKSPAKINLFLSITSRRDDGYHNLETLFQLLDIHDTLHFKILSEEAQFNSVLLNDSSLPIIDLEYTDSTYKNPYTKDITQSPQSDNLVIKAATSLLQYCLIEKISGQFCNIKITIDKILPLGAGLGGGSSNAATTLLALNKIWQTHLSTQILCKIGSTIGADVPIFVTNRSAFATGIGDIITPVTLENNWFLVIYPNTHVNTRSLFQSDNLIRNAPTRSYEEWLSTDFYNIFEPVACAQYPQILTALQWLKQFGQAYMTGTGSTVFCQFDSYESAELASKQLPENWWGRIAQGVNTVETFISSV